MKVQIRKNFTIGNLIELKRDDILKINYDYQRGKIWKPQQQQAFIDSVIRGYGIPAFYFHKKTVNLPTGETSVSLYIIDGQQRTDAIWRFHLNTFTLKFDEHLPESIRNIAQQWAGKKYADLSDDLKKRFWGKELVVYDIETEDDNEIRDLFIRLQGGTPLADQEIRDVWPSKFGDFVIELGGKKPEDEEGYAGVPAHLFFWECAEVKQGTSKCRQLVAQVAMLFLNKSENHSYCDIASKSIDNYYRKFSDFDAESEHAKDLKKILDFLSEGVWKIKLKGHEIICLVLFIAQLKDNYPANWRATINDAFLKFRAKCAEANKQKREGGSVSNELIGYDTYNTDTKSASAKGITIRRRQEFFSERMIEFMGIREKDEKRLFDSNEKDIIYHREHGLCEVCGNRVDYQSMQIHHISPHNEGGQTELSNGALVHNHCHPRSGAAVKAFAEKKRQSYEQ